VQLPRGLRSTTLGGSDSADGDVELDATLVADAAVAPHTLPARSRTLGFLGVGAAADRPLLDADWMKRGIANLVECVACYCTGTALCTQLVLVCHLPRFNNATGCIPARALNASVLNASALNGSAWAHPTALPVTISSFSIKGWGTLLRCM